MSINKKNKKMKKEEEIALIKSGNIETLTKAIKNYALSPKAQCILLEAGNETLCDLYLKLRRPCAQFVAKAFKKYGDNKDIIKKICVGCSLSEDNEASFVRLFADDAVTLEEYLRECPEGPTFLDSTFEVAEELGISDLLAELENKFAVNKKISAPTFVDLMLV